MTLILAITGEKLAGKDTAAAHLVKRYGAYHARHSRILDEILHMLDLPVSRRNEIDLAMGLRNKFGTGIISQGLVKRVQEAKGKYPMVAINGVRFQEELEDVKKLGGRLLYVTAPEDIRYRRYLARREKADDTVQGLEEFRKQEQEPTEAGIHMLGAQADFKIENTGNLEDFFQQLDNVIKAIK